MISSESLSGFPKTTAEHENLVERIFHKAERLAIPELIEMGRPGLDRGTRGLIEHPYIIVYEVHEDRGDIVVLSIVHGAQDRRPKDE